MSEKSDPVAKEVLSYLSRNPRAQDTLSGIADWWLEGLDDEVDRAPARVESAVRRLCASGVLRSDRGADGRVRYRLATGQPEADRDPIGSVQDHREEGDSR